MIKRRAFRILSAALAPVLLLAMMLSGCGRGGAASVSADSVLNADPAESTDFTGQSEPDAGAGRQDGERFEDVIILEGIESAEGFGRRFRCFLDTFSLNTCRDEKRISDEQALAAIRKYCYLGNPDLEDIVNAGEYPVAWDLLSSDEHEIAVLFRSYTGAQIRCHIDPVSGDTYVTEFVPGISSEEARTEETLNVWDYLG